MLSCLPLVNEPFLNWINEKFAGLCRLILILFLVSLYSHHNLLCSNFHFRSIRISRPIISAVVYNRALNSVFYPLLRFIGIVLCWLPRQQFYSVWQRSSKLTTWTDSLFLFLLFFYSHFLASYSCASHSHSIPFHSTQEPASLLLKLLLLFFVIIIIIISPCDVCSLNQSLAGIKFFLGTSCLLLRRGSWLNYIDSLPSRVCLAFPFCLVGLRPSVSFISFLSNTTDPVGCSTIITTTRITLKCFSYANEKTEEPRGRRVIDFFNLWSVSRVSLSSLLSTQCVTI